MSDVETTYIDPVLSMTYLYYDLLCILTYYDLFYYDLLCIMTYYVFRPILYLSIFQYGFQRHLPWRQRELPAITGVAEYPSQQLSQLRRSCG